MTTGRTIYFNPSRAARPQPENAGFERFKWYFMRVSGLRLVLRALGHVLIMHVLVQLSGRQVDFAFVSSRWGTPFWRIYDLLLLLLALVHGVNGARIVIGDYVRRGGLRAVLIGLLVAVSVLWVLLGMIVIIFFNPATAPRVGPFA